MIGGRNVNKYISSKIFIVIIIILILISLNAEKYILRNFRSVPVWTNYENDYYENPVTDNNSLKGKINKIKNIFKIDNIIFYLTGIKAKVPITYLKKEIPMLANYNPGVINKEENILYKSQNESSENKMNIIKLKFDLRAELDNEDRNNYINENKDNENNERINENKRNEENFIANNKKLIAIYHTHTSETYIDDSRPQDMNGHVKAGNIGKVAQVGRELARVLSSKYHFKVIHTTKVHDQQYSLSYLNSRKTVKELLKTNNNFDLILDIHRNGIEDARREDVLTTINGKRAAKIMMVVTNGKFDFAHLDLKDHHTEWEQNLSFARKLENEIKSKYPNLLQSDIEIRDSTYNQDLHPRAILVEIGDYRNTTTEAMYSARLLAGIIAKVLNE